MLPAQPRATGRLRDRPGSRSGSLPEQVLELVLELLLELFLDLFALLPKLLPGGCFEQSRCIWPHLRLAHRAAHGKRYVHTDDAIERDAGDFAAGRLQQPRRERESERPGAIVSWSLAPRPQGGVRHVEALVADHGAVEPALRLEPVERRVRGASAP